MIELKMAKTASGMLYIGSFGPKLQRLLHSYCSVDDDDKCRRKSPINRLIVAFNRSDDLSYTSIIESMIAFDLNG